MNDINANFVVWLLAAVVAVMLLIGGCVYGCNNKPVPKNTSMEVTERVEQVIFRTELKHDGCPSNGFWRVSGQAKKVEVTDPPAMFWPHVCSGCGATQAMVNVCWPKFRREWRAVK